MALDGLARAGRGRPRQARGAVLWLPSASSARTLAPSHRTLLLLPSHSQTHNQTPPSHRQHKKVIADPGDGVTAWDVCVRLRDMGLLTKPTHGGAVRLAPPLVMSDEQMDEAADVIRRAVLSFD